MATTPLGAVRYPVSGDVPNIAQYFQNLADDVSKQLVPRFASIADRNAKYAEAGVTLVPGMACTVAGLLHTYGSDSVWHWSRSFPVSGSTDANGTLVVAHQLGATPTGVQLTRLSYPADSTTDARVNALGSTTFSLIVANSSGAGLGNNPVAFSATAFV